MAAYFGQGSGATRMRTIRICMDGFFFESYLSSLMLKECVPTDLSVDGLSRAVDFSHSTFNRDVMNCDTIRAILKHEAVLCQVASAAYCEQIAVNHFHDLELLCNINFI